MEKFNELALLEIHVKALRFQDRLGKQNYQEEKKKVFEPVTKTIQEASEDVPETMMVTSEENNNRLANLNNKLLRKSIDRVSLALFLVSLLSKITSPEHTSQFKLEKILSQFGSKIF